MNQLATLALWIHSLLLRCYPRRFREEFGEEVQDVFEEAVASAKPSGWLPIVYLLARELRDWPLSCLREHLFERNRSGEQGDKTPVTGWGAVAAAFPFLIPFLLFTFTPIVFLGLPFILLGGVVIAWFRHWPGWIVSWLGYLILIGGNWLPSALLGSEYYNNPSFVNYAASNVALPILWYVVTYLIMRRWLRHGLLVALPVLMLPWAFSMEFASAAMSTVVYSASILLTALFAIAIYLQRRTAGDIWLYYFAAIVPGAIITVGAVRFSPGMENAWQMYGGNVLEAIVPFIALLLLASLHAWARATHSAARRAVFILSAGFFVTFTALLSFPRLVMPSLFEEYHVAILDIVTAFWLLGALLTLFGAWRIHAIQHTFARRHLVLSTLLLLLLPFLQRPYLLSNTIRSLTYRQSTLSALQELLPAFGAVDRVIIITGVVALFLFPFTIAYLRHSATTFPASDAPGQDAQWRHWRENATVARPLRSRRKVLTILMALTLLISGGAFLGFVFLPLQLEDEPYTSKVVLGDLDGDGDLDAVIANTLRLLPNADNKILYNEGGVFSDSGLLVGQGGTDAILVDASDEGSLDIVFGGMMGIQHLRNEGRRFSIGKVGGIPAPPDNGASNYYLDAGDLNGDGYDDIFLAGCCGFGVSNYPQPNEWIPSVNMVLLGSETGFANSGQALGVRGSQAIALGDVDGDGDLDAFIGNTQTNAEKPRNDEPNEVWLNDGRGLFRDSGQLLGRQRTYTVALGDIDGDGDLDALAGNEGADELWLNDGQGNFTLSDQSWVSRRTLQVFLVDLDSDGDLDAVTGHELSFSFAWYRQGLIWWNDGTGAFTQEGQRIRYHPNAALGIGDVTGDGRLDVISAALDKITIHYP